jgi:hypothetical protein
VGQSIEAVAPAAGAGPLLVSLGGGEQDDLELRR